MDNDTYHDDDVISIIVITTGSWRKKGVRKMLRKWESEYAHSFIHLMASYIYIHRPSTSMMVAESEEDDDGGGAGAGGASSSSSRQRPRGMVDR